jgi:hypothetical protein
MLRFDILMAFDGLCSCLLMSLMGMKMDRMGKLCWEEKMRGGVRSRDLQMQLTHLQLSSSPAISFRLFVSLLSFSPGQRFIRDPSQPWAYPVLRYFYVGSA